MDLAREATDSPASPSPGAEGSPRRHTSARVLLLPLGFTLALAAFTLLPAVRGHRAVLLSFLATSAVLLAWWAVLAVTSVRAGRTLSWEFVLRRPHWMQPIVQGTIYVYWGMHTPLVLRSAHLILAQIVFAYAFDQLLVWSRREVYYFGFGPWPIIFSTNLFLWFKPDWFYLQFALVAVGFAAKEFFRWTRDGQKVHIFNPSSFPLAVASLVFLLFGGVDLTFGREIASGIASPDYIFELLFLVALPGQFFFGVAMISVPALLTAFGLGMAYQAATGVPFYYGPIPPSDFLGMLLLITDPSTAPKSELGRVFFGVLYGLAVFVTFGLLDVAGVSTIYDKLLLVPLLNLSVRQLDLLAASPRLRWLDPARLLPRLVGLPRNAAAIAAWSVVFLAVRAAHGVGPYHPAYRLPFWLQACAESRRTACTQLSALELDYCEHGSGWACNEVGRSAATAPARGQPPALLSFEQGCKLGFGPACVNQRNYVTGVPLASGPPPMEDYRVLLDPRQLGPVKVETELLERACAQGWRDGCAMIPKQGR
jgi:hypothetical protein